MPGMLSPEWYSSFKFSMVGAVHQWHDYVRRDPVSVVPGGRAFRGHS